MRGRSMAAIAAIGLLGVVPQVNARGGGAHGGGAPHGAGPHMMASPAFTHGPGSIAPVPPHDGPLYAVAPTDRANDGVRHDFRQDDRRQDGAFGQDRDRFGAAGVRIGFPGGSINFAPRPPRRSIPVLYNYYYGGGGNYYSNVTSDYGAPAAPCSGWGWDPSTQTRVWLDDCQR
jgi:hypothetical protein